MALKEKQTQLKASNNATYKTVEGVTYFKLKSEFEGDYTKHCGLLGEEIDENFYFLRGYDIESFEFDDNNREHIQWILEQAIKRGKQFDISEITYEITQVFL